MRFRAKDSAIRELIALLRANHIARITSDLKMDLINTKTIRLFALDFYRAIVDSGPRQLSRVIVRQ